MDQHGTRPARTRSGFKFPVVGVCLVATVSLLAACSSTSSSGTTTTSGSGPTTSSSTGSKGAIPASAFSDHTGITANTVTVANISTASAGLFAGAPVGTEAYADYVNSTGGINGRKLIVKSSDDGFTGATNKQQTQSALQNDFAMVGGFTLEDGFGGTVVAANPGFPDVAEVLDPTTAALPNAFSPSPGADGWPLGPLTYFKKKYPSAITHAATIVANLPSTVTSWNHEKAVMEHLGYKVLLDPALPATTTDFTEQVVAMKNAGVKILFLEQSPQNYASATIKDLNQQDFHPILVLGGPSYSGQLVANSGGAAAIDGTYFEQSASLYLGEDAAQIPAVKTFQTWVQKASPGFKPDEFTLYGWLSAELFAQALQSAGKNPSRGSTLQALRHLTAFDSGNLIPVSNPAGKVPISCYLLGQIKNGTFQRLDDPPVNGPTHGYRCDQPFYYLS